MALVLWVMWEYLGGMWWPRSTSGARRVSLRANRVAGQVLAWAFVAGVLAIIALAGYWIVLFQLVRTPPNAMADFSAYPAVTAALVVLMASLVSPVTEEAAFRGYCQVILEREFAAPLAVLISSVFFCASRFNPRVLLDETPGVFSGGSGVWDHGISHEVYDSGFAGTHHRRHGVFCVGLATRRRVWDGGGDAWFWLHAAQAVLFTALSVMAFFQLAKVGEFRRRQGDGDAGFQ